MILEVCIDSVESAIAAEDGGAKRVELCSSLVEGGVTPGAGLITMARRAVNIEIFVMIRPRGGDFCYSGSEFEVMQEEIRQARRLGADGVVLGLLDEEGCVDIPRTRLLVELAAPLPVTFHRAIDMTPDPLVALQAVADTGACRVLTSGGASNAADGAQAIAHMVASAQHGMVLMPGGGISAENIESIVRATGAEEFHASLRTPVPSLARFRKHCVAIGAIEGHEYDRFTVRVEAVRALVSKLDQFSAGNSTGMQR